MSRNRPHRRRPTRKPQGPKIQLPKEIVELTVQSIGAKGDGLATDDQGQNYFVPLSCAGDQVKAKITGKKADTYVASILEVVTPGAERVDAPCAHFGTCGGCSLQHITPAAYADWKKERVIEALRRHAIDVAVEDPICIDQGQRRRASFAVMKKGKKIVFGFNARASHFIAEIDHCLLLTPRLNQLIPALRDLLQDIMKQEGRGDIIINDPLNVSDIVFALPGPFHIQIQERMMAFAQKHNIGRMSWQANGQGDNEIIAQLQTVTTEFADVPVALPPNPFLQPSKAGENALVDIALSGLTNEKKVLDLYAGCGSFTLPLAKKAIVHAVEANAPALKALEFAAGQAGMGGRITTEVRDLTRQPLMGKELEKYEAVLFDPPRAGAKEQAEMLAESSVALIIGISCNPATFARDARALIDGGYTLKRVVPVDQFTWSAHVEVAAIFTKQPA